MTPIEPFLRWIPKRRAHPLAALGITVLSVVIALAINRLVLRYNDGDGNPTAAWFPALIIIAIYAGWRWSLGTLTFIVSLVFLLMVLRPETRPSAGEWIGVASFVLSAGVTVIMAGAARELLVRLNE